MLKNRRERWLAAILGGSLGIAGLGQIASGMLLTPFQTTRDAISALCRSNADLESESETIDNALQQLKNATLQSLPADTGKAAVVYQAWLIRQLTASGVSGPTIVPGPAIPEADVGHRISVSIECSSSAAQIAGFLDRFHRTPLLHRINHLSILNTSSGVRDEHRFSLSIEALALASAKNVETLPEPDLSESADSLSHTLASNNIFRHAEKSRFSPSSKVRITSMPTSKVQLEEPAKPAIQQTLRFVASVWNGTVREAWFVDRISGTDQAIGPACNLQFHDHVASVIEVTDDQVILEMNGKRVSLNLGQTVDCALHQSH